MRKKCAPFSQQRMQSVTRQECMMRDKHSIPLHAAAARISH